MKKIKFEMDQNMASLVVASFAGMIGTILAQRRDDEAFQRIGGRDVLAMPYGGHVTIEAIPQIILHKTQIMANLSTAFSIPQWMDMAYACQEKAIAEGALPPRKGGS